MAQRAYRARNQANMTALTRRVAQLETALERMSQAVVSFSDDLVQSDALVVYPNIADRLRDTVETCLSVAKYGEEGNHSEQRRESARYSMEAPTSIHPSLPNNTEDFLATYRPSKIFPSGPDVGSSIDVPAFIEHLRLSCLHRGLLLLKNPSVSIDSLKRPFRLLLPLVPRETITAFFHARLHARLNRTQPEQFSEIPFFHLGGAGTHFLGAGQDPDWTQTRQHEMRSTPSSELFTEIPADLDGEWFDVHDLKRYLQEKEVCLTRSPAGTEIRPLPRRAINAFDFTAGETGLQPLLPTKECSLTSLALMDRCICLGHSPGFRRRDVEGVINSIPQG